MTRLHDSSIIIDGLNISRFERSVFEDMRNGGVTAVNCTVSVWEDFQKTIDNIVEMKQQICEHGELLMLVRTTDDILRAKRENKTGIILGFQNAHAFEDNLGYIEVFKELGVNVVQLCYNTQNLVGTGSYEPDGGLSGYGREVIQEMNRVGIMVDLSHVGAKTSSDAIACSKRPVTYSHCCPAALKAHPRNKTDDQLREIAEANGFVGVTMFMPFLRRGADATIDDYLEAIEYVIDVIGEDKVGIGTDFTQGYSTEFFDWITHDKGRYRRLTDFGKVVNPEGIRTIGEFPNLTAAMQRAGWSESLIRKVMGENWLRVFGEVWNA
ncbi:peptidase M19 [Burkholderia territorii]|nr:dipeptidase [Burkholderia territorii]KWA37058.1 peptidase M19 [Burkholderia territorii]